MEDDLNTSLEVPVALSIATSDCGGGAGSQADLLSFAANQVFGTTLICCLTAQNPDGVTAIEEMPPSFIEAQWERLFSYFSIKSIKTGMLFSEPIIHKVSSLLSRVPDIPKVVDPVMVATSGAVLLKKEAVDAMSELLKMATLVTPNLDEMTVLTGRRPKSPKEMASLGSKLAKETGAWVLVKGGHLATRELQDVLASPDGNIRIYESTFRPGVNTHGSGCTLASAIAAALAKGKIMEDAVQLGHQYLQKALAEPLILSGTRFLSHGVS